MDAPVKDETLRLLHIEAETAFIEKKLAYSAAAMTVGVVLAVVLFALLSHVTRWTLSLSWLVPTSLLPVIAFVHGLTRWRRYKGMQREHRAFLRKYNRI